MSFEPAASIEAEAEAFWPRRVEGERRVLVIACGALAREILALREGPLGGFDVTCLPAALHNRPERIAEAMREKIRANRARYDEIFCLYGDCGTAGELDRVLAEERVTRIDGPHCYAFYAGEKEFTGMMEQEPGTFFLTDFLARHFERLVIEGLGLDRFPQLRNDYFGHYRRLVYLAQTDDSAITEKAEAAARRLGLDFERRFTGLGGILRFLRRASVGAGADRVRREAPFSAGDRAAEATRSAPASTSAGNASEATPWPS
jgi:hypothetical protein